jgi:taurine dioxygenase
MTVAMSAQLTSAGGSLGATLNGINLARVSDQEFNSILAALAQFGVLRFPAQQLSAQELRHFSARFGELEVNVANAFQEPGVPEVMILSNVVVAGHPIGLADAGQDWHTDMSYNAMVAFANVLYAIEVPYRDGRPLGATEFCDMAAAYAGLPAAVREQIEGCQAWHDFSKFWDKMRSRPGSTRAALTELQRRTKPPVLQPMVIKHPLSGDKMLYVNPGYAMSIEGMEPTASADLLDYLFAHQTQHCFRYTFDWSPGDVLLWDDLRTIHRAVADYSAGERRLIKRCQVMASKFAPSAVYGASLGLQRGGKQRDD